MVIILNRTLQQNQIVRERLERTGQFVFPESILHQMFQNITPGKHPFLKLRHLMHGYHFNGIFDSLFFQQPMDISEKNLFRTLRQIVEWLRKLNLIPRPLYLFRLILGCGIIQCDKQSDRRAERIPRLFPAFDQRLRVIGGQHLKRFQIKSDQHLALAALYVIFLHIGKTVIFSRQQIKIAQIEGGNRTAKSLPVLFGNFDGAVELISSDEKIGKERPTAKRIDFRGGFQRLFDFRRVVFPPPLNFRQQRQRFERDDWILRFSELDKVFFHVGRDFPGIYSTEQSSIFGVNEIRFFFFKQFPI